MAYQVLALKYRPRRFGDVVGQEHVTRTLARAIGQGRIAHAYLFSGPRGTGKTTLARIFAKCLNCTGGPRLEFEDQDERCREIDEGRSLDVLEIDGASNRGIEEIRNLRETIRYGPTASSYKIYIIDEVHMLTKEAFNALLKTLEEPPAHAKFLFATTEPDKVLPTVLSRCQRFALRRIPSRLIAGHLAGIAEREGIEARPEALMAIARGAAGGMRDAQSTLDQLRSYCEGAVEESDVLEIYGMASRSQILQMAEAMLDGQVLQALELVDALVSEGRELERLLGDLLSFLRNLLLYQVSKGNESLLPVPESEMEAIRKLSGRSTRRQLEQALGVLADCERQIRQSTSKRIFLEVALCKAVEAAGSLPLDEVLGVLQQLRDSPEGRLPAPSLEQAQPTPAPASPARELPAKQGAPGAPAPAPAAPPADPGAWERFVSALESEDYGYLRGSQGRLEGEELTISFSPREDSHLAGLLRAASAQGYPCKRIRFIPQAPAPDPAPASGAQAAPEPPSAQNGGEEASAADRLLEEEVSKEVQSLFKARVVSKHTS